MPKLPGGLARRFALLGPSLFFVDAGVYDFVNPHLYIQLRPPYLPAHRELVYLSGVLEVLRTRGSHLFLRHPDGRTTVIPVHAGETLGPGLLGKILRDVDLSRDELVKLL